MSASLYEKNIGRLRVEPHFVRGIDGADSSGFAFEPLETKVEGCPSLRVVYRGGQVTLHSGYNPVREAEALIVEKAYDDAGTLLVYGFGLGYHCEAALRLHPDLKLIVVDLVPALFQQALRMRDFESLFADERVTVLAGGYRELRERIIGLTKEIGEEGLESTRLLIFAPELSLMPDEADEFRGILEHLRLGERKTPVFQKERGANIEANTAAASEAPGVSSLFGGFRGKPVFVVASGPSLDLSLERLGGAREVGKIICVDSALPALKAAGVSPHYVVTADPQPHTATLFAPSHVGDETLIFFPSSNPEVVERFSAGNRLVAYSSVSELERDMPEAKEKGTLFLSGTVFLAALDFAVKTGADPVVLVGADFAVLPDRTHATGVRAGALSRPRMGRVRKTKGADGGEVLTTEVLYLYLRDTENYIEKLGGKPRIVNATARGAFVTGAERAPLEEVVGRTKQARNED